MWRQAQPTYVYWFIRYCFKSKRISYHQGRKQRYFISCFSLIFPFALALTCKTRRKKAISQNLKSNVRSGTDCLEPLPGCLPSLTLKYSSSSALMDHVNAKVVHHFCYAKRLKQKVQRRAGTDHYSTMPFLQNRMIQTEEPRSNPSSASTTLSKAKVSHIIRVERTPDLTGLF